jgi:hypothetical protein
MFLTIPVLWVADDWERQEDLGQEVEYTEGDLTINTAHIVAYHKDDDNCLMIRLTNGDVFRSRLCFDAFKKLLRECEITVDLQVTDN